MFLSPFRIPERRRRALLPAGVLLLAAMFFLVFRPLRQRGAELDRPLAQAAEELASALGQPRVAQLDAERIERQRHETERCLAAMQAAAGRLAWRIELRGEIQARLGVPFELFDYQYERQLQIDELARLAKQHQVKLEDAVLAGFPQHTIDTRAPALLWARLELLQHLAATAIQNRVAGIHTLRAPEPARDPAGSDPSSPLVVVPLDIELTGPMSCVTRFLRSLPLRASELKAEGLPELAASKPPLFVERLLLLKQSPAKPDEVRLSLHACGFVRLEGEASLPAP
ncbi:MAG: hypothetical protein JXQ71_07395 [Verrucomicrobia bacterium]|nr:hypothetical protein [Verrucomicrobiota bacterium]